MKRIALGVVALALSGALSAQGERWQPVTVARSGLMVSIDTITVVEADGVSTVWVRYDEAEGHGEKIGGKRVVTVLQREAFHCRQMMRASMAVTKFDATGVSLESHSTLTPQLVPVVPDTVNESVWRVVCKL